MFAGVPPYMSERMRTPLAVVDVLHQARAPAAAAAAGRPGPSRRVAEGAAGVC